MQRDAEMAKENALDLQNITRSPESYFYDSFEELKRKVDLRIEWDFCQLLETLLGDEIFDFSFDQMSIGKVVGSFQVAIYYIMGNIFDFNYSTGTMIRNSCPKNDTFQILSILYLRFDKL